VLTCGKPLTEIKFQASNFRTDGTLDGSFDTKEFKLLITLTNLEPYFHGFWETACDELFVFGKSLVRVSFFLFTDDIVTGPPGKLGAKRRQVRQSRNVTASLGKRYESTVLQQIHQWYEILTLYFS
jgi:hypothetical protein